jgi:hypothetical protein
MYAKEICSCLIVLSLASQSRAQIRPAADDYGSPDVRYYTPIPPLPPELGFTYHHASTAAEGWLRGRAAVIHATGNYELSHAQAEILYELARWVQQYNHRQRIAFRVDTRNRLVADRQLRTDLKRTKNETARVAKLRAAYYLTSDELNRTTGDIEWPRALRSAEYRDSRARLDELFRVYYKYLNMPRETQIEITKHTRLMTRDLRRHLSHVPRDQYFAAHKFIRGLQFEAELASQVN